MTGPPIFGHMILVYNAFLFLMKWAIRLSTPFNEKARKMVAGQRETFSTLSKALSGNTQPVVWMHCASLGEFEQGRPVLEGLKKKFPDHRIILSFFSPSGYEVRKNYKEADVVIYLPFDSAGNAQKLVEMMHPALAIFVKYEFWYHYTFALYKRKIPLFSISAIFREDQLFFKSYGGFYRKILNHFTWFFVQNERSVNMLHQIGIRNAVKTGDTRFDRVYSVVKEAWEIPVARAFKGDQKILVAGSCWQEDLDVLLPFLNEKRIKCILAPHEVTEAMLSGIEKTLTVSSIRFSQADLSDVELYQVLLIDNVGMLSRLYKYGEFAFVGGGFGKGLHNILEAAAYGIPVIFGNKNYEKFQEAQDLIHLGGAFEVGSFADFRKTYEMLNTPETFLLACEVTRQYVEDNTGATEKVLNYCIDTLRS